MLKITNTWPQQKISNQNYNQQTEINIENTKKHISIPLKGLEIQSIYNEAMLKNLSFKAVNAKKLKINEIKNLKIGNLQFVESNGLRGETLSSKRHRRFLPLIKEYGITSVIDLRDKFTNENYGEMCKEVGLKYYHIPVDSYKIDTSKIIENMPLLFKIMDDENYYMACALGLHRTDIAQTINYLFNPKCHEVPVMYGFQRDGVFKRDDIMRRIGSIKKEITQEQLKSLGWDVENFERIYQSRKEQYVKLNNEWAKEAKERSM